MAIYIIHINQTEWQIDSLLNYIQLRFAIHDSLY